jgi:hypothetical protein
VANNGFDYDVVVIGTSDLLPEDYVNAYYR